MKIKDLIKEAIKEERKKITPEQLANKFHDYYESLAPQHDYKTRKSSAVAWKDVPENNKKLMIAVCKKILEEVL